MTGELVVKRRRGRPRKVVVEAVAPVEERREEHPLVDEAIEALFEGVQAKALRELKRRVNDPGTLRSMGVDELKAVLGTCRENLVVLRSLGMGDGTGDMKMDVVTSLDMEEKLVVPEEE